MPPGVVHQRAHLIGLAPVVLAGAAVACVYPVIGACAVTGYIAGRWVESDLDQISITSSEGEAMRRLGILGVLWVMLWMPYAYLIPHRHWLSHAPFISGALRLVYLLAPPLALAVYLGAEWQPWMVDVIFGVWVGLSVSDSIHAGLDVLL